MAQRIIRVTDQPFEPADMLGALEGDPAMGALASFTGLVRGDDGLIDMTLEHYPGMTEKALDAIAAEACTRFDLGGALIVHRYGRLRPAERIMMVAAVAAHRAAAFDGASFMMDYLKSRAPFWKSERRAEGASWVAARAGDDAARDRW